jgi:hypothetical protein
MPAYFFDTCALKHRYARTGISPRISRIVSNHRYEIYISELTVVELGSAFADYCKAQGTGHEEYDRLYRRFFRDVARKRIIVREISRRDLENARHLIRFAKVIKGRHLKSADAIVAETCRDLSYELGDRVTFYSCDQKLHKTLNATDAYRTAVKLRYVQP